MTPYSLVFGGEAVLPLEVQIASLRVATHEKLSEVKITQLRLDELERLEGKRLQALQNLEAYKLGCLEPLTNVLKGGHLNKETWYFVSSVQ